MVLEFTAYNCFGRMEIMPWKENCLEKVCHAKQLVSGKAD